MLPFLMKQKRRQGVLKFFSLFTTVKGISASVKRRSYLDSLLGLVKKHMPKHGQIYTYVRFYGVQIILL